MELDNFLSDLKNEKFLELKLIKCTIKKLTKYKTTSRKICRCI